MTPARISIVPSALDPTTTDSTLADILEGIGNGRWQSQVKAVRTAYASGGKPAADVPKRLLPGALFSGTFTRRASDALQEHSGLICVDLDHLGPQLEGIRDLVASDEHTLAAFISPTGTGLKVIFRCDPTRPHIESYRAAERYVLERFGLQIDTACKDVSRICFVSHDPDIMVAESAVPLPYPPPQQEFKAPAERMPTARLLAGITPGDDYDQRGDVPSLLLSHGWTRVGRHGWRRPGKESGISATWDHVPGRLYVFSSSTAFTPNHVYRGWHVYAMLEHGGDFSRAARALGELGFGEQRNGHHTPLATPTVHCDMTVDDDGPAPTTSPVSALRPPSSYTLPPDDDPSILLGDRYLNRGDAAVLSSTSGMGKSSMSIQMAYHWALGRDFFGIKCQAPLRSLIIQSEDSDGDVAEICTSIAHVLALTPSDLTTIDDRIRIVSERVARGSKFIASLRQHIAAHKPDLVIINPLQAFMDGDVTDARDLGRFLREELNSLNTPPSFAYVVVHHTTKPSTGKDRNDRQWHEVMYDMAGGAEIINWARAIMSLRAAEEPGDFNLILAKRGRRAGVTQRIEDGLNTRIEPVTTLPLRHAKGFIPKPPGRKKDLPIIFWESRTPSSAPAKPAKGGRPERFTMDIFRPAFPSWNQKHEQPQLIHRKAQSLKSIELSQFKAFCVKCHEEGMLERSEIPGVGFGYRLAI